MYVRILYILYSGCSGRYSFDREFSFSAVRHTLRVCIYILKPPRRLPFICNVLYIKYIYTVVYIGTFSKLRSSHWKRRWYKCFSRIHPPPEPWGSSVWGVSVNVGGEWGWRSGLVLHHVSRPLSRPVGHFWFPTIICSCCSIPKLVRGRVPQLFVYVHIMQWTRWLYQNSITR